MLILQRPKFLRTSNTARWLATVTPLTISLWRYCCSTSILTKQLTGRSRISSEKLRSQKYFCACSGVLKWRMASVAEARSHFKMPLTQLVFK